MTGSKPGLVRCYWLPVQADAEVWGQPRAHFLDALVRKRVVGYVTRGRELLVFDHGDAGGADASARGQRSMRTKTFEAALAREVEEETGITGIRVVAELADADEFERFSAQAPTSSQAFHAVADAGGPERVGAPVTGTGMDAGLVFLCRWVPLDERPPLWGKADPLVERLRRSIAEQ